MLVHGTCVALGTKAALLRGESGAGKSDLALRFLSLLPVGGLQPRLVADDQVQLEDTPAGTLVASPPATLAGKLEVRGLGIVAFPYLAKADLVLVVDLVAHEAVPRMPPEKAETALLGGVEVPVIQLAPFELSAPLKLRLALISAAG